ncbi:MAG: zf-HC2 domain-containing protein [Acidobacteriota bacterium]|nr:MAG: zf-HC2 domain-containing protein [Acidobacteriota bacterium]
MKRDCLDIGVIQAFIDGELPEDMLVSVSDHLSACDDCLQMVSIAEAETLTVFTAMERELGPMVPTQRLWSRINDQIESERRSIFGRLGHIFSTVFMSPSMAVSAAMILAVTAAAVLFLRSPDAGEVVKRAPAVAGSSTGRNSERTASEPETDAQYQDRSVPKVVMTSARRSASAPAFEKAVFRSGNASAAIRNEAFINGEEVYLKTISAMRPTVDNNKDGVLSTAERIAYERELAVIEDSISRTKKELKRNPKSESARQVLLASYQNKIDLLNSVVQREELIASLR